MSGSRRLVTVAGIIVVFGCGGVNHPPRVEPMFAEIAGERVRVVEPGDVVTVEARATDQDGDALQYRWHTSDGTLITNGLPRATWRVGESAAVQDISVRVIDEHGAGSTATVRVSTGPGVIYAGQLLGADGQPIAGAKVDIDGVTATTDAAGRFSVELSGDKANAERLVANVRAEGYADFSQVLSGGGLDANWVVAQATVSSFNPSNAIFLRDSRSGFNCVPPWSSRIDWDRYAFERTPRVVDEDGEAVPATLSDRLRDALAFVLEGAACSAGASVSIPPSSLVGAGGAGPTGNVDVAISTVNLFSPGQMPGGVTVAGESRSAYMESLGAADVTVSAGGERYQLSNGAEATLEVPVPAGYSCDPDRERRPTHVPRCESPPDTIPLLAYDPSDGVWVREGTAALNASRSSYVATLSHLSTFNMDYVKTDPACLRIDSQAIAGPYELDVIIPTQADPVYRHKSIANPPGDQLHALFNLPPNTDVGLIPMRVQDNPSCPNQPDITPIGIFVGTSGDAVAGTLSDQNLTPPYPECGPSTTLTDLSSSVQIVVDGAGVRNWLYPGVFYALADGELLPIDGTDSCSFYTAPDMSCSLIGIYDTGNTRTRLQTVSPNALTGSTFGATDATLLGAVDGQVVDLRLNGLTLRGPSGVPEDAPGGANPAEVEVPNMTLDLPSALDLTLIGTEATEGLVVTINYTNPITNIPEITQPPPYVADVHFYKPGDPTIPTPDMRLELDVVDPPGPQPPRYLLRNLTFQAGCEVVDDRPRGGGLPEFQYMYDTGAPRTVIGDAIAGDLGLQAGQGTFDCGSATNNGYEIERFTVAGVEGSYVVNNPNVCWDQQDLDNPVVVVNQRPVDAIIGSNLFHSVEVIVDAPDSELGVRVPVP